MKIKELCIELVWEAVNSGARKYKACDVLGIPTRTLERWEKKLEKKDMRQGPNTMPANKLSQKEKKAIIEVCISDEYKNLPPSQIVPRLADKGIYLGSESTFYRVLKEAKLLAHRDDTKPKNGHKPDEHIATAPDQVWSWDVTYLKTYVKGIFFYLNFILDIYSRKIVGWDVYLEDNADNASLLAEITCMVEGIASGQIVLHADNGKSQKGATTLGMLEKLGVAASFSRPSVSNDNPYSESLFKTLKYVPAYPEKGFGTIEEARIWVDKFVTWYNTVHLHSGIKFVTPESRHSGKDRVILENRKDVYERAKVRHPNRWSGKTRNWEIIENVSLNPLTTSKEIHTLNETVN